MLVKRKRSGDLRARKRRLSVQTLETRRVLASSVGWDGPGLGSAELTYYIANSPSSLSPAETTAAIETALAAWSNAADITFTETSQSRLRDSIDISFTNIDGAGGVLAQAYFPDDVNPARIAGDIQFDIGDSWEVGNSLGNQAFDLVWVAAHEIGHSLGLDHLDVAGSVLAPFVTLNRTFAGLSSADVAAIQELYTAADATTLTAAENQVDDSSEDQEPTDNDPGPRGGDDASDQGDTDDNPFPRWRWRRGGNWGRFGGRLDAEVPENHNLYNPTDVNGDDATTAIDALAIINQLSGDGGVVTAMCDTNADGTITAIDALMVINAMYDDTVDGAQINDPEDGVDDTNAVGDAEDETGEQDESDDEIADETDDDTNMVDDTNDPETPVNEVDDTESSPEDTEETDEDAEMNVDDGGLTESDGMDVEQTDDSDDDEDFRGHHHLRRGLKLIGKSSEQLLTRFDQNEDGSLTEDEVPDRLWSALIQREVDADADGMLTAEELN